MSQNSVNLGFKNRWNSLKRLNNAVNSVLLSKSLRNIHELEILLKHHKTDFISLSNNPPRNAHHKEIVVKAAKEGITVIMQQKSHKEVLSQEVVDEALLMSEMFNMNELVSLELIITGERQLPRYPGAVRGPVAVMLYYDSQRSLLLTLKLLLQGLGGRTWSGSFQKEVHRVVETFINSLKNEGIIEKAIEKLETMDVKSEFDLLLKNKALGPGKFKKQVYDFIKDIRELYADIVFSFAAQFDLNVAATQKLVKLLATLGELDNHGTLDKITTSLLMSVLYLVDVSSLQYLDGGDSALKQLPALKYPSLIKEVLTLASTTTFAHPDIVPIINFACGLTAKTITLYGGDGRDDDDSAVDQAIDNKVFEIMNKYLANNRNVNEDEFFMRRIHGLLLDFPTLLPHKMKDIKEKGDEMGHLVAMYAAESIRPPTTMNRVFEKYLQLLADFYANDNFNLSADIWKPSPQLLEETPQYGVRFSTFNKFIQNSFESVLPQGIHIPMLKLLAAFAKSSPFQIYNFMRQTDVSQKSQFSFDNYFSMFHLYLNSVRGVEKSQLQLSVDPQRRQQPMSNINQSVNITATELDILCGILELIEAIVANDRNCSLALAENQQYNVIQTLIGLIVAPVSRKIKAAILSCLGGFAKQTPSVALSIWLRMDVVLPKPQLGASFVSAQQQRSWQNGICIEIEDIEPRSEEYLITRNFLKCIKSLIKYVICNRELQMQASVESAVSFIISAIFLKLDSRNYKREDEKWKLVVRCLEIIQYLFDFYEPLSDANSIRASFSLMNQISQENALFRSVMRIVEGVSNLFEPDASVFKTSDPIVSELMKQSLVLSLKIMRTVSRKQHDFQMVISEIPGFPSAALVSIATLFTNINPRKNEADRLATLMKIISLPLPEVQLEALKLLRSLVAEDGSVSQQCLLQSLPTRKYHEDYLFHGFVDCVADSGELRLETLQFIRDFLQSDCRNLGSYGLAFRLLGFDPKKRNLRAPGSLQQTFNCLHAIISFIQGELESASEERRVCLDIIYLLCSDPETCTTTLRFLRTSYELVSNYLSGLIVDPQIIANSLGEVGRFWRILATELKQTSDANLKSYCYSYVKLLLGDDGSKKLIELNPSQIFSHNHPDMPSWEFFDANELWKTLSECSGGSDGTIDVKVLHQKLLSEVRQLGPQLGAVQANLVQNEIKKILAFASDLNASREALNEKVEYFDGWRELVEILVVVPCLEVFEDQTRAVIMLELIHELLIVASSAKTSTLLLNPISSMILLSASRIRSCKTEAIPKTHVVSTAKAIGSLLEVPSSSELWSTYKRARANLYAALLYLVKSLPPGSASEFKLSYRLLEKLCKDTLSGQELVKVLATSVLTVDDTSSWVNELASDGSLRLLVNSLILDDKEIKASKCERYSKAYYSFDSKMALLIKIASSQAGARLLIHSRIVDVLSELDSFEMYPFLVNQNEVCFKVFLNVMRLMITITNSTLPRDHEHLSQFITARASVFYDLLRLSHSFDQSEEVKTVIVLVTSLLSQLIHYPNSQLQRLFIGSFNRYAEALSENDAQVIANIMLACVKLSRHKPSLVIFSPSWEAVDTFVQLGQPSVGSLVYSIDSCVEKAASLRIYATIVESSLYLIWHHLNLHFNMNEVTDENRSDIQKLRHKARDVVSDQFFLKVQSAIKENPFVDALIRRIKRIIHLTSASD